MPSARTWLQALVLVAAIGCHRGEKVPDGDVVATLTARPVGASAFDPASLHGKPAVVMFVSSWCPHCLKTIPHAEAAAKAMGVPVVAVFVNSKEPDVTQKVRKLEFGGTVLLDDGTLLKRYDIKGVPYSLVLGADGHARAAFTGEQDESTFRDAIADAK